MKIPPTWNASEALSAKQLAASVKLPCGIICANDVMALGVIDAAKEPKLEIPVKIGVIGFDDISMSSWGSTSPQRP